MLGAFIKRLWMAVGVAALPFFLAACGVAWAQQAVIRPGERWMDTSGRQIQAHGGGILRVGRMWYWFGEDRGDGPGESNGAAGSSSQGTERDAQTRYVSCYASRDLVHWEFRRQVLKLADPEHLGAHWVLERPKVFYNAKTKKFVMYAHLDDARYKLARVAVAVSDAADGDYRYVRSFRPLGEESRDIGQFIDDDGTAYLIFESRPTGGFFIAKLSDDYLDVAEKTAFLKLPLEGGAIAHVGGRYYVMGSHLTGWKANPNVYAVAKSITGPWSEFKDIAPPEVNTYGSQSSMLVTVRGSKKTTVIYVGDVWKPQTLWDSRYLWMPLEVDGDRLMLPAPRPWSIDVKSGVTRLH